MKCNECGSPMKWILNSKWICFNPLCPKFAKKGKSSRGIRYGR